MWTTENRQRYGRRRLHYPGDLTDAGWTLRSPLILPVKRGDGKRTVNLREVFNGLKHVLSTGC